MTIAALPAHAADRGGDPEVVRFAMAVADAPGGPTEAAVRDLAARVGESSDGTLVIEPTFGIGDSHELGFEVGVADLVLHGAYDLALTPSRAWALAGVSSLQALEAPFLIDNDALARAVATSQVADEALAAMGPSVVGLAMWPDGLRRLFSFPPSGRTFRSPADVAGAVILAPASAVTEALITALGAELYGGKPYSFRVYPGELTADADRGVISGADVGTSLARFPRPDAEGAVDLVVSAEYQVLAANAAAWARLSDTQRNILEQAARQTARWAADRLVSDAEAALGHCANGGTLYVAGSDAVDVFREAVAPVRETLAREPFTARLIADIDALKAVTPTSHRAEPCGPTRAVGYPVSDTTGYRGDLPPDGSYRAELTFQALLDRGASRTTAEWNAGLTTWTFKDGEVTFEAINIDGHHRCHATMESVEGRLVRLTTTFGSCDVTLDFLWRPEPDGISMLLLEPPPGHAWSLQTFVDNQALLEQRWIAIFEAG
jgi:TRAP-type C4-dicarboxylate transport system substrate-binding protein